jgi:hypothetical protein
LTTGWIAARTPDLRHYKAEGSRLKAQGGSRLTAQGSRGAQETVTPLADVQPPSTPLP